MEETSVILSEKKVDKKVAGIIRWLERLKKSCSSGAIESALMDAECARADLENLRLDVWATLDRSAKPQNKFFPRVLNFARICSLAAIIVMLAVFPVSKEIKAPVIEHKKENVALAEPIIIIREKAEKAESKNELKAEIKNEIKHENYAVKPKKPTRTNVRKPQTVQAKLKTETVSEPERKTVAYDKVFSLVRTGERALKNNGSIIKSN